MSISLQIFISFFIGMITCYLLMITMNNNNNNFNSIQDQTSSEPNIIQSRANSLRMLLETADPSPILSTGTDLNKNHHHHHLHIGKKYFIDFGANSGDTVQHFVTPQKANEGKSFLYNYDIKGLGSDGDWHIVAVEANPNYTPQLEALKAQYLLEKKVRSFELFNGTAVFTRLLIILLFFYY